jgi:hypothetical protein
MFRFAADEHGWPMRAVEHRPVACVPIPEKIGILRASQSAGHKPAGRTDWKSMFRLGGLNAAITRCSSPQQKSRHVSGKPQQDK